MSELCGRITINLQSVVSAYVLVFVQPSTALLVAKLTIVLSVPILAISSARNGVFISKMNSATVLSEYGVSPASKRTDLLVHMAAPPAEAAAPIKPQLILQEVT